jgi:hypothetical protein
MRRLLLVALVVGGACTNNDDVPPPHVDSVLPDHAPSGGVVEIDGGFFCQVPMGSDDDPVTCSSIGSVDFDEEAGTVTSWSDAQIMVEVPAGEAGMMQLSVTANGRVSNHVDFTRSSD